MSNAPDSEVHSATRRQGFAHWQHPFSSTQVFLHSVPLRALADEALRCLKADPPSEIGGVLWGSANTADGDESTVVILDAEFVPSEGPLYNRTAGDRSKLESALQHKNGARGLSLVGYFRTHVRDGLCLSQEDQDL